MYDDAMVKNIPVHGTFTLTQRCNLQCSMCYICNPEVANEELSGDQWLDIMKQARDAGMTFALITGGEPMMHKDFWQIYSGLRKLGVYVTVNSNGTTITPEIADRFKALPPVRFAVSVYGSSPEAYKKITGSAAAFDKLVKGLELLRERDLDFRLRTILTKDTAPDIENIVRFTLSYGVPFAYGNYVFPKIVENCNDPYAQRLHGEELAEYTGRISKTMRDYLKEHGNPRAHIQQKIREEHKANKGKKFSPERAELKKRAYEVMMQTVFRCHAGIASFGVTHNGFIRTCEIATDPLFDLKKMSFKDAHKQLGEAMRNIPDCPECVGCPDKPKCKTCPPRNFIETGSYEKAAKYVCEYIRAGVKLIE